MTNHGRTPRPLTAITRTGRKSSNWPGISGYPNHRSSSCHRGRAGHLVWVYRWPDPERGSRPVGAATMHPGWSGPRIRRRFEFPEPAAEKSLEPPPQPGRDPRRKAGKPNDLGGLSDIEQQADVCNQGPECPPRCTGLSELSNLWLRMRPTAAEHWCKQPSIGADRFRCGFRRPACQWTRNEGAGCSISARQASLPGSDCGQGNYPRDRASDSGRNRQSSFAP